RPAQRRAALGGAHNAWTRRLPRRQDPRDPRHACAAGDGARHHRPDHRLAPGPPGPPRRGPDLAGRHDRLRSAGAARGRHPAHRGRARGVEPGLPAAGVRRRCRLPRHRLPAHPGRPGGPAALGLARRADALRARRRALLPRLRPRPARLGGRRRARRRALVPLDRQLSPGPAPRPSPHGAAVRRRAHPPRRVSVFTAGRARLSRTSSPAAPAVRRPEAHGRITPLPDSRLPSWGPRRRARVAAVVFWGNLLSQMGIILSGGAVRLTGSGLGCSSWPNCEPGQFTPQLSMASGIHPFVEFGNRSLTGVLSVFAIAVLVVTWRWLGHKGVGFRRLALVPLIGTALQALLGAFVVWLDLHPGLVSPHFLISPLLGAASM